MLAAAASLAPLLGLTTMVTPAGAATLACGQTITVNTTLDNDVGPCSNDGIIVGANNITFNLNGHRIFGTATAGDGAGVLLSGRTGVTVRAGTVTDFDGGVVIEGGSGNTVQAMTVRDNIGNVSEQQFTDYGDGILVFNSGNNRVLQNSVVHNGPYSGITLLGNSDNNVVQSNSVERNDLPDARPGFESPEGNNQSNNGIRLETINNSAAPDFNRVFANVVRLSGFDGIAVFPLAKDNVLDSNTVTANGVLGTLRPGDGIHVFGRAQRTIVRTNRVIGNARHGIILDFFDPTMSPPGANRVERNTSLQNGVAPGRFPAFDLTDQNRFCDGNVWLANTFATKNDPGADCIH
ncbi:MAG TPA: right-handed parallel beta-helix repeat-containing protein [Acidimicrobiales bacterium]